MKKIKVTDHRDPTKEEIFSMSLTFWANYMETGSMTITPEQVISMYGRRQAMEMLPPLDEGQRRVIKEMRRLALEAAEGNVLVLEKHQ